jgi:hypothetical protein
MLSRFGYATHHPPKFPLNSSMSLLIATTIEKQAEVTLYQALIGSLNHISLLPTKRRNSDISTTSIRPPNRDRSYSFNEEPCSHSH